MKTFISGLDFVPLADLVVGFSGTPDYIKNISKEFIFMDNYELHNDAEELKKVKAATILFIKKDALFHFFLKFQHHLKDHITIITHNSDYPICEPLDLQILNCGKIDKWYGQNAQLQHPKLSAIPIGIDNKASLNPECIAGLNASTPKNNLVYINFSIYDSHVQKKYREETFHILQKNGFTMQKNKKMDKYMKELSSFKFCICPRGNGIDTHRIWECIYLNVIPIVLKDDAFSQFQDLPILFINDWEMITKEFLLHTYQEFSNKKFNTEKCYMEYWIPKLTTSCTTAATATPSSLNSTSTTTLSTTPTTTTATATATTTATTTATATATPTTTK